MDYEVFYRSVAEILGVEYEPQPLYPYRESVRHDGTIRNTYKTRWNGRTPGNGRFPGHGLVRAFGSVIQVSLTNPPLTGYYDDPDAALAAIKEAMNALDA